MAGVKITELTELTGANASDSDVLVIVDVSEGVDGITKYIEYGNLLASQIETAEKSDRVKQDQSIELGLRSGNSNEPLHLLASPIGSTTSQHTAEHSGGLTGYDSVSYAYQRLYWLSDSAALYSREGIRTRNGTGRLEGIADRALVADSANFELTSINGVTNTFTGLVSGQVLKYNGTEWVNQNDNTATPGTGIIAKQITTKSAGDLNVSFLIPMVRSVGSDSVEVDNQLTYNANSNTLTTDNFAGNASTATLATTATTATNSQNVIADSATTGALYPLMREDANLGADSAKFDLMFTYNATSETLSAPNFSGDGSAVTNVAALTATSATNVAITSVSNDATYYVHFGDATSGTDGVNVASGGITYNPNSDLLSTDLAYTPNNGTHWIDPDPTTVAEAIDRLAAVVYALNGNTGA